MSRCSGRCRGVYGGSVCLSGVILSLWVGSAQCSRPSRIRLLYMWHAPRSSATSDLVYLANSVLVHMPHAGCGSSRLVDARNRPTLPGGQGLVGVRWGAVPAAAAGSSTGTQAKRQIVCIGYCRMGVRMPVCTREMFACTLLQSLRTACLPIQAPSREMRCMLKQTYHVLPLCEQQR